MLACIAADAMVLTACSSSGSMAKMRCRLWSGSSETDIEHEALQSFEVLLRQGNDEVAREVSWRDAEPDFVERRFHSSGASTPVELSPPCD